MTKKKVVVFDNVQEALSTFQNLEKTGRKEVEDAPENKRGFVITEASIKDDYCNYSFEIIDGIGVGDTHSVKGSGIIEDDLRNAFANLNVHLAAIDDIFKHSKVEILDIDELHSHELTMLYHVTSIKIKGGQDNESIIIKGNKYVSSAGGRMEISTPQVPLDNLSSYKWYNELKDEVDLIREEVALYKEGKYSAVEEIEPVPKFTQPKLEFNAAGANDEDDDSDSEFEKAKF